MSTYVLIHGAWHGAWCWEKVLPLLRQAGHTAIAPDLPGHGQDKTPIPEVTLQGYVQRVCDTANAQNEPVILVGHSMGGVASTEHRIPVSRESGVCRRQELFHRSR